MSSLELVLFWAASYCFGLVSDAVVIPWLVDRGLFPVYRQDRWPSPTVGVPLVEASLSAAAADRGGHALGSPATVHP